MKVTIPTARAHAVPVTYVTHGPSVFRHATHYQRTHLRTVHAAAIEEPQIAETDESWDKDEAYRRFEALLDQHSLTFSAGDKVRSFASLQHVAVENSFTLHSPVFLKYCYCLCIITILSQNAYVLHPPLP